MGTNNLISRSSPVQVGALTNWASVATQGAGTFAVKTDGTLWAWGYNSEGELGIGNVLSRSSPVQVGALTNWASVGCSPGTLYAIKKDGTMWGSGDFVSGQFGVSVSSPVQISSGETTGTWLNPASSPASRTNAALKA